MKLKNKRRKASPASIFLTKSEVQSLYDFCEDNLAVGRVEIQQDYASGIGPSTRVMVENLPETLTYITDIDSW